MTWPQKFKERLELTFKDIEIPDKTYLVYGVCGCYDDSCGWEGWIIESAEKTVDHITRQLKCMNEQICPNCGKKIFRTDTQIIFIFSEDQSELLIEGRDYVSTPMKFESRKKLK